MGPLNGVRIVELAGIGPAPFCAMLLADMGADVLRIDRPGESDLGLTIPPRFDIFNRNKRSVAVDLKNADGVATLLRLIAGADMLIEGFRPGVTEKLGLGPEPCLAANAKLVYGRMTGWGQDGPLARTAGHDLNYIALTGALHAIGPRGGAPVVPLNLVGDLGGGALYLAMGLLAALTHARVSGEGQVIDAAMVDGVASMMGMFLALRQMDAWHAERGVNLLDGGAHFYGVYETADARHVAVAAVEARFYRALIERMGLGGEELPAQHDERHWPAMRTRFADVFRSRTRDDWTAIMEASDACFAPVLDIDEALAHPIATERSIYGRLDGIAQPMPAPRFSRTPGSLRNAAPCAGADTVPALRSWGFSGDEIEALFNVGAISAPAAR